MEPRSRTLSARLLLAVAVGLAGNTVYRALPPASVVPPPPALTALTDAAEAANRRREFAGTYATGDKPGDRTLTLHAAGRVEYAELGTGGPIPGGADTFELRRRGKKFAFATARTGVIDAVDLDTLTYWGDTYRRR